MKVSATTLSPSGPKRSVKSRVQARTSPLFELLVNVSVSHPGMANQVGSGSMDGLSLPMSAAVLVGNMQICSMV